MCGYLNINLHELNLHKVKNLVPAVFQVHTVHVAMSTLPESTEIEYFHQHGTFFLLQRAALEAEF